MFENFEKYIVLIMAIIAMVAVGSVVNPGETSETHHIRAEENTNYVRVTVKGEVNNPGEYMVKEGMKVCDVIYAAGGITHFADIKRLNPGATVTDKTTVTVYSLSDMAAPDVIPVTNINTANTDALCLIPGVGETIAQNIVNYRKQYGEFSEISEIMNVDGIGEKTFEKIKDYIKTEESQK